MTAETCLQIEKLVYPGRALARTGGMVTFVDGALPGEQVQTRIVREHKNYREAIVTDILEPAAARQKPGCPLSGSVSNRRRNHFCPGCAYDGVDYQAEWRLKQEQFFDLLNQFGGGAPDGNTEIEPAVAAPAPYGYRNKLVLHRQEQHGHPRWGYFGPDNRTLIEIPACPLAENAINLRLDEFRHSAAAQQENVDTLTLRRDAEGRILCAAGTRQQHIPGAIRMAYGRLGSLTIPAGSFAQVHSAVASILAETMLDWLTKAQVDRVIDLYCGSGLFSRAATRAGCREVLGMDTDRRAIRAAEHNLKAAGSGAVFLAQPAAQGLRAALSAVDPATVTVLADPPRRGLEPAVCNMLADANPRRIVYVSCAPDTLARDLGRLRKQGYQLQRLRLLDMFPRTPYFETMVWLESSNK